MRYEVFAVPAHGGEAELAELNRFLDSHRVVHVERRLVDVGSASFWSFCIGYATAGADRKDPASRRGKVDYRAVLSPEDFSVYCRLRELRKELAQRDAVPAYHLFTNDQLAALVTRRVTTRAALASVDGVGPARVDKYGEPFLASLREAFPSAATEPGPFVDAP